MLLCNNVSCPSSYLNPVRGNPAPSVKGRDAAAPLARRISNGVKAKPTAKAVSVKPLMKSRCPTKRYRTTKNAPSCSPTQRATLTKTFASRGFKVARVIRGVRTTAYAAGDGHTPGTRTACGTKARSGTVAVDPRIIPLRTYVYVRGYGFGRALDTGGRIKGKAADLCFGSVKEAKKYGVQKKDIYVLTATS